MYDVIIVGGSFAGLAVASQLKGYNVLLIDRKPIGSGQTSACGTVLSVLERWNLTDAVLEIHEKFVLHTKRRTFDIPSPYPWCTFDYERLCKQMLSKSGVEFVQAGVTGYRDGWVHTNRGLFNAHCVVDASGWRAVLGSSLSPGLAQAKLTNFGIETIRPISNLNETSGLHFWYDPDILERGAGWVFPRGGTASYGLGSYRGARPLQSPLEQFSARFNIEPDGVHGTHFPSGYRAATMEGVFLVGDSAGMCIGLTGEGIRPAFYFGEVCGRILRKVLEHELTLDEGLAAYEAFVESKRIFFDIFTSAQWILTRLPARWIDWVAAVVLQDRIREWLLENYWNLTKEWEDKRLKVDFMRQGRAS